MKWLLVVVMVAHGLIHFLGVAKAFEMAELSQLATPISRPMGVLWLAAGLLMIAAAALLVAAPRVWWLIGLVAVALSQAVIVAAWTDAKFGTLANLVILAAAIHQILQR